MLSFIAVSAYSLQCFQHDDGVASNDLTRSCQFSVYAIRIREDARRKTYDHSQLDLLSSVLLFHGIVQNDIQENLFEVS